MRPSSVLFAGLLSLFVFASSALAQTWSLGRQRPSLFEIIAVDALGDPLWPYGQEDLAGDGVGTLPADEAAIDLRSLYADARAERLWLRAYVAAKVAPSAGAVAFFFIDSDARTSTGGKADGSQLWPAFGADPTPGGYERAVGVRGDGTLLGVFFWDTQKKQWNKQPDKPPLVVTETGAGRDPLRLLGDDHGYFQLDLALSTSGLDAACGGTIFVRLWNDAMGKRAFGDDAGESAFACHARLNASGDPELLQPDACTSDASCPAQGHCRGGVCAFSYECSSDDACPSGYVCAPNGSCLHAANSGSAGKSGGGSGKSAAAGSGGDQVRGGAFSCAAAPLRAGAWGHSAWLPLFALCRLCTRRRRPARACGQAGAR